MNFQTFMSSVQQLVTNPTGGGGGESHNLRQTKEPVILQKSQKMCILCSL